MQRIMLNAALSESLRKHREFLPEAFRDLVSDSNADKHGRLSFGLTVEATHELREALIERLAATGFDSNDELTAEGRALEELIDEFFRQALAG